jgi:CubicO group peptidase (beta-lactamase class C family)
MTGLRDGTPAEAGLSARRLDRVRDLAARWVKDGIHPAIVALVARHGVIALHEAYGKLGPEPDAPALPRDALWPLASLVKPITATALMMLVEDGRVGLTRPVSEYLPEFAGAEKDTVYVHHLLTHTSGIEGPFPISDEFTRMFTDPIESAPRDPSLMRLLGSSGDIAFDAWAVGGDGGAYVVVDLAGDVALEASDGLAF